MMRPVLILLLGALIGAGGYWVAFSSTGPKSAFIREDNMPALGWLKQEFKLSDADYRKVCDMHREYLSGCAERCAKIDEQSARLRSLMADAQGVTAEIEQALAEVARLRADCQKQMLVHCFKVSQTMPPEQGRRYLEFVEKTIIGDAHSQMTSSAEHHHMH